MCSLEGTWKLLEELVPRLEENRNEEEVGSEKRLLREEASQRRKLLEEKIIQRRGSSATKDKKYMKKLFRGNLVQRR